MLKIKNPFNKGNRRCCDKKKLVQTGIGKLLWKSINFESERRAT